MVYILMTNTEKSTNQSVSAFHVLGKDKTMSWGRFILNKARKPIPGGRLLGISLTEYLI